MSIKIFTSNSAKETQKIAAEFAQQILRLPPPPIHLRANGVGASKPAKTAVVLALSGDLGTGKTTFLQGFAEGLGIKEKIYHKTDGRPFCGTSIFIILIVID